MNNLAVDQDLKLRRVHFFSHCKIINFSQKQTQAKEKGVFFVEFSSELCLF